MDDVLVSVKQDSMARRQVLLSVPTERARAADWQARHEYMDLPELAGAQQDAEGEQGSTPRSQGATPRSQGATPRSQGDAPRSQGDSPRSDGSDIRTASDD